MVMRNLWELHGKQKQACMIMTIVCRSPGTSCQCTMSEDKHKFGH
jgi:hypothetical protein